MVGAAVVVTISLAIATLSTYCWPELVGVEVTGIAVGEGKAMAVGTFFGCAAAGSGNEFGSCPRRQSGDAASGGRFKDCGDGEFVESNAVES